MKKWLLLLLLLPSPAWADAGIISYRCSNNQACEVVGTSPTTVANSTISVTNTFQTALAANPARHACAIQNQGTHVMYIYLGAAASATTAASLQVAAGQTFYCNNGTVVAPELVNITGTAGDAYVVYSQ
jgi:hypothetical protein